jgi:hypothetical protein
LNDLCEKDGDGTSNGGNSEGGGESGCTVDELRWGSAWAWESTIAWWGNTSTGARWCRSTTNRGGDWGDSDSAVDDSWDTGGDGDGAQERSRAGASWWCVGWDTSGGANWSWGSRAGVDWSSWGAGSSAVGVNWGRAVDWSSWCGGWNASSGGSDHWVAGGADNCGAGWAVGDSWGTAGDGDQLSGVDGGLGRNSGGEEGSGGSRETHFG